MFALTASFGIVACAEENPGGADGLDASSSAARVDLPNGRTCQIGDSTCVGSSGAITPAYVLTSFMDPNVYDCHDRQTAAQCADCHMGGTTQCCPAPGSLFPCVVKNCLPDKNGNADCNHYP